MPLSNNKRITEHKDQTFISRVFCNSLKYYLSKNFSHLRYNLSVRKPIYNWRKCIKAHSRIEAFRFIRHNPLFDSECSGLLCDTWLRIQYWSQSFSELVLFNSTNIKPNTIFHQNLISYTFNEGFEGLRMNL